MAYKMRFPLGVLFVQGLVLPLSLITWVAVMGLALVENNGNQSSAVVDTLTNVFYSGNQ